MRLLTAAIMAAFFVLAFWAGAKAEPAKKCYPLASLKVSFQVVFPKIVQSTIEGADARLYLAEYNSYGPTKTNFKGDTVLLNMMPDGTVLAVPIDSGQGCERIVVGRNLHKMFMLSIARGRS